MAVQKTHHQFSLEKQLYTSINVFLPTIQVLKKSHFPSYLLDGYSLVQCWTARLGQGDTQHCTPNMLSLVQDLDYRVYK